LPLFSSGDQSVSHAKETPHAIMGIKQDIKDSLNKFEITKIDGKLTEKDMN
jgi:hypothetical protein